MSHWVERAIEAVERDLENEAISYDEYLAEMRDIREEARAEAEEAAENYRNQLMGDWQQ